MSVTIIFLIIINYIELPIFCYQLITYINFNADPNLVVSRILQIIETHKTEKAELKNENERLKKQNKKIQKEKSRLVKEHSKKMNKISLLLYDIMGVNKQLVVFNTYKSY